MTYYSQRLIRDSEAIRQGVHDLGRAVELSLRNGIEALLKRDAELAYTTIIGDHPINRKAEELTRNSHFFIAKHLPSAGHLRFVSSALRMIVLLERLGDYAATIARESTQLETPLQGTFRADVEAMATDAMAMFDRALTAFSDQDEELARETARLAGQVDRDFYRAIEYLTSERKTDLATSDLFSRLVVISQLERVSDQAKNICEETVFAVTGETKVRRPMRILVCESGSTGLARLASSIGSRFFSDRALFSAATSRAQPSVNDDVDAFMEEHGLDVVGDAIETSGWVAADWAAYDVIICLNASYTELLHRVPSRTVAFDWWIPESEDGAEPLLSAYRFLRTHLEELVEILRGPAGNPDHA